VSAYSPLASTLGVESTPIHRANGVAQRVYEPCVETSEKYVRHQIVTIKEENKPVSDKAETIIYSF
jgi:hypothetical protein